MSDEDINTLAYTKSPKFSKRTTFQEELQEALLARAAKQQSSEYSEDFESDEEGSEEEFPETVENTPKKSISFATSKYNLRNMSTLKRESADDLSSSDEDERPQYVSRFEREILSDERQAEHSGSEAEEKRPQETAMLESKHRIEERQEDDSVSEEGSGFEEEGDQQEEEPVFDLQIERDDTVQCKTEIKPVPRPREFKTKAASASAENISIPARYDYAKPSSQPRSVLRKSSHVEDYEGTKAEDRTSHSHRFSLSAPSSETRLNDQVKKSENRALSESPGPEGPWIASSSSPFPIHFSSADERTGDSNLAISAEESSSKEDEQKETDNCNDLKLLESGRESPSVIELMMTTVYEKNKKLHKSTEDYLEGKLQALEHSAIEDGSNETTKEDNLEQKEEGEEKETFPPKAKSPISRSFSSTYLKKTGKHSPIPISTSSQYLGTLKVLDNKHLQKFSAELDKADSLRAAVYQDWLEKKRIFLLELQRIKRNKAENLREKNEKEAAAKKEEALASFEAWKAMKEKEAKKLAEKKRLEEAKKKMEAELNEKKKEEAQKAVRQFHIANIKLGRED
uniref:Microtubule associated protein 9 n=1 Tax=Podarcis muralis TaxID=64176 RepID=A0A670J663_PODMU